MPAIKLLDSEHKKENFTFPFFILLDEANLSPMEHYWADFMKVCDSDNNQFINIGEQTNCVISKTLRFFATINYDTTTESLSPRLLDRAWIINIDGDITLFDETADQEVAYQDKIIGYSNFQKFFGADIILTDDIIQQQIPDTIKVKLRNVFEKFSKFICISPRVQKAILKYYYVAKTNNLFKPVDDNPVDYTILDYSISQKILPLINVFDGLNDTLKALLEDILNNEITESEMPKSHIILKQIIEKGYNGYYNYFNR